MKEVNHENRYRICLRSRHCFNTIMGDDMTDKLRQAARQVLDAFEKGPIDTLTKACRAHEAIAALRAALAEQPAAQEPVAWMCSNTELMHKGYQMFSATGGGDWNIPVYTAPQPAKREPLTDEEIMERARGECQDMRWPSSAIYIARAIERAHGIGEQP